MRQQIKAYILSIGEELLEGSVVDTNSAFIAKQLQTEGVDVVKVTLLPDDIQTISDSIENSIETFDLIITTGGLGPTFDDVTAEAVAKGCNLKLSCYKEVEDHIAERLAKRYGIKPTKEHLKQAQLPEGCFLLKNLHGTAYGFAVTLQKSNGFKIMIASMPGVPAEMYPMLREYLLPHIKETFNPIKKYIIDLRFGNIAESTINEVIMQTGIPDGTKCIINASSGEVIVKVRDSDKDRGRLFAESIKSKLISNYIGSNQETPAYMTLALLKSKNMTLSVAESCTGGMLGSELTSIPGSSEVFLGGIISYNNEIKKNMLGVDEFTLNKYGAVSQQCSSQMAYGVKKLLRTDCSISITGIAGPEGGSADKPVGTVFISVCIEDKCFTNKFTLNGERDAVRRRSVRSALVYFLEELNKLK